MAGQDTDSGEASERCAAYGPLQESRDGSGRSRFAEEAFLGSEPAVGSENLVVGHSVDDTARLLAGADGAVPRSGVADPDGGRDRFGVPDGVAEYERRRTVGLKALHLRALR